MTRRLTKEEEELREKLVILEERIRLKIRWICTTHLKLPYERLAEGRRLKELCLLALSCLDQGDEIKLKECLQSLREKGIKV